MNEVFQQGQPTPSGPYIETAIDPIEAQALSELASEAGLVLEVGTAYGYSTIVMALAGAQVEAVDPHLEFQSLSRARGNLAAYGVQNQVRMVIGYSATVLPDLPRGAYGLAFVDGDHSEAAVAFDIAACWELLRPGGWLAAHDYCTELPGVMAAIDARFPSGPDKLSRHLWQKQKP